MELRCPIDIISLDFSKAVQHVLPEISDIDLEANSRIGSVMHEVTIGPASRAALGFYLHESWPRLEILRMQQVVNSRGVMRYREVEVLVLLVSFLEISEKWRNFFPKRRGQLCELRENLLCGLHGMRHL